MILGADDIIDWIADRQQLLVAAWTTEIAVAAEWDRPFAEVLASELHDAMTMTLLNAAGQRGFLDLVARSNTGLSRLVERQIAERFFGVTLKLGRAACRSERERRTATSIPFKRGIVVGDSRTDPAHLPIADVILPIEHNFWSRWHPPFGPDCRCGAITVTRSQLERSPSGLTSEAALAVIERQLVDTWPNGFRPLLDFRQPFAPVAKYPTRPSLSAEQFADVMRIFKGED